MCLFSALMATMNTKQKGQSNIMIKLNDKIKNGFGDSHFM